MASPLNETIKKEEGFQWGKEQHEAFDIIKYKLTHASILTLPNFEKSFDIECGASNVGIRGVLLQEGHPIAYFHEKVEGVA